MKEYIVSEDSYEYEMRRYDELKELIRCKDCKFSMSGIDKYNERYILCQLHERSYGAIDDGFCSWAERRNNVTVD